MTAEVRMPFGLVALVDDADFDLVAPFHWSRDIQRNTTYARSIRRGHKTMSMHHLILGADAGQIIDHRNGDGLDNQRHNLRLCTNAQNQQNRQKGRGASSFKGVSRRSPRGGWQATIKTNGRTHYLGSHATEIEAARAYDRKALELFGEFAGLNFPDDLRCGSGVG